MCPYLRGFESDLVLLAGREAGDYRADLQTSRDADTHRGWPGALMLNYQIEMHYFVHLL